MHATEITPDYTASPQITVEDVAEIAALGYRSIMCNRPDGESPDQTAVALIGAEARRHGLGFAFLPVVSGFIQPEDVESFRAVMAELPKPVYAYCRSGSRCRNLWLLSER